jgi:hypothetical protein
MLKVVRVEGPLMAGLLPVEVYNLSRPETGEY